MTRRSPSHLSFAVLVLLTLLSMCMATLFPAFPRLPTPGDEDMSTGMLMLLVCLNGLVVYGGLGYLGYRLSLKLGFADLFDDRVTRRERFLVPLKAGLAIGVFMVAVDAGISQLHDLGPLPHPAFPVSIVATVSAALGEEMLFRMFLVPFWMWLLSLPFKGRHHDTIFWIAATLSALAFAAGHLPAAPLILNIDSIAEIPGPMWVEIFLLNGVLSFTAAYYFRKYGFLAAVGVHFWNNVVWHVIWGAL